MISESDEAYMKSSEVNDDKNSSYKWTLVVSFFITFFCYEKGYVLYHNTFLFGITSEKVMWFLLQLSFRSKLDKGQVWLSYLNNYDFNQENLLTYKDKE